MSAGVMRSINKSVRIVVMNEDELLAAPSVWVQRFAPLIPAGGEVLDLACGRGRHARLLATLG
jgi:hypothetical protein